MSRKSWELIAVMTTVKRARTNFKCSSASESNIHVCLALREESRLHAKRWRVLRAPFHSSSWRCDLACKQDALYYVAHSLELLESLILNGTTIAQSDRKTDSVMRQRTWDVVQLSLFWPEAYALLFVVQAEFAEAASNVSLSYLQILSAKIDKKSAFDSLAKIDICVEESASKHLRI